MNNEVNVPRGDDKGRPGEINVAPQGERVEQADAIAAGNAFRFDRKMAKQDKADARQDIRSAPVKPADPVRPAAPVKPADPVRPAAPVKPADPVRPAAPVKPADPVRQIVQELRPREAADSRVSSLPPNQQQPINYGLSPAVEAVVRMIIREMVPAAVLEMDRTPPGGDVSLVRVSYESGHFVYRYEEGAGGGFEEYHFMGSVFEDGVKVTGGKWTRNGVEVVLEENDVANVVSAGPGDYVYLELVASEKDPALVPYAVELKAGALPDDAANEDKYLVLGMLDSGGVWDQFYHGGDKDDQSVVPDHDRNITTGVLRDTIQFNPHDEHQRELQLYDVHNVELGTWAFPYFKCGAEAANGSLEWAALDSMDTVTTPEQKSLEITSPGTGSGRLQIYDFQSALDQEMMVVDAFATPRKANYHYPVLAGDGPRLTGAGTGPDENTTTPLFYAAQGAGEYTFGLYLAEGNMLTLSCISRPVYVADGRLKFAPDAQLQTAYFQVDLSSLSPSGSYSPIGHDHDGDYSPIDYAHNHADLTDILADPEIVDDHDARYWPHAGLVNPDLKSYITAGDVQADKFALQDLPSTNYWDDGQFKVAVGVATIEAAPGAPATIELKSTGSVEFTIGGNMKMNAKICRSGIFHVTDPNTGENVELKFENGVLVS